MSGLLEPGMLAQAAALPLTHEPLAPEQVRAGSPTTASMALAHAGAAEIGVWEMTPGTATDTEIDEVFVVLAGRARVEFTQVPGSPAVPAPLELVPGSVARLSAGMRTLWTVHETLRKIYIA